MKHRIIEKEAFQVIGINREFPFEVEGGAIEAFQTFWNEIQADGTLDEMLQLKSGDIPGVLGIWAEVNKDENKMNYYIATEFEGEVPSGFKSLTFPSSKWVVFEVQGPFPSAMASTWERLYSEWFPTSGYVPSSIKPFEVYMDTNIFKEETYNEIWIPIQ